VAILLALTGLILTIEGDGDGGSEKILVMALVECEGVITVAGGNNG
jgi:hypothetical protein